MYVKEDKCKCALCGATEKNTVAAFEKEWFCNVSMVNAPQFGAYVETVVFAICPECAGPFAKVIMALVKRFAKKHDNKVSHLRPVPGGKGDGGNEYGPFRVPDYKDPA